MEAVEGEVFTTNNDWPLEVAVTDDRTNVLLVDSVPRWEFRYLRNLFYGRDKSVHLQYVLLNPDEIIFRVQNPEPGFEYMRPDLEMLKDTERECECPDYVTGE